MAPGVPVEVKVTVFPTTLDVNDAVRPLGHAAEHCSNEVPFTGVGRGVQLNGVAVKAVLLMIAAEYVAVVLVNSSTACGA